MGMAKNDWEVLQFDVVAGAAGATNIALTGLTTADSIQKILAFTSGTGIPVAVSLAGLVITAGNFKVTASTSGTTLLVVWAKRSAG